MHRFWRYSTSKYTVTLKPGLGVTQDHRKLSNAIRHHDFLLTFHSNHRPISHRFRDKRRCTSKIARKSPIFSPPVYLTPQWRGSPWKFLSVQGSQETRVMRLSVGRKSFWIGLAVLIQYRSVTPTHPSSHVVVAITLYAIASSPIILRLSSLTVFNSKTRNRNITSKAMQYRQDVMQSAEQWVLF